MSVTRHHAEWLSLVETSGPFLGMTALLRAFPQGLDAHDPDLFRELRLAYEEWLDNQAGLRPDPAIHTAWVRWVLRAVLELDDDLLAEDQAIPPTLKLDVPEHGETLRPTLALLTPPGRPDAGAPRLLIQVYPRSQDDLDGPIEGKRWKATPTTRMTELLHATGARLGLITNGEQWLLVNAPRGETTGLASWYAAVWLDEPITLRAFRSLLGAGRFFNVPDADTLDALLTESASDQTEVTDLLGLQVRTAVEVLVRALDRADKDRHRELLAGIAPRTVYESALTLMMRLVFLMSAEERGLFLLGDPLYDQHYAVSTLRAQLREAADRQGDEVLERRFDAWARLLATFRAVYGGVEHEALRLPGYGGALFDPDRFPFLEGRLIGTSWRDTPARALPISNLTVLHLLEALQVLQVRVPGGGVEARRLSFRALDVEQIGHVYEGLLDHTARRAHEPLLELRAAAGKSGKGGEPIVPLAELEREAAKGETALLQLLKARTGRSDSALKRDLAAQADFTVAGRLLQACDNDTALRDRVLPFLGLLDRADTGEPAVITPGSLYVGAGADRRSSGTHYTPRSLTEPIVRYTLEPLVYHGPAEGLPPEQWTLRKPRELLDLKVCDIAMGSGAFLVQACRYLSERLVEAWEEAEARARRLARPEDGIVPGITPYGEPSSADPTETLIPRQPAERLALARRMVADRCLYGVDKNPMAVEMAKLSLWLTTLDKGRPFTFVDHALKAGDSLVGVTDVEQIVQFHPRPSASGARPLGAVIARDVVAEAARLRQELERLPTNDIGDVLRKQQLNAEARARLSDARLLGDLVAGVSIATAGRGEHTLKKQLALLEPLVLGGLEGEIGVGPTARHSGRNGVNPDLLRQRATHLLSPAFGSDNDEDGPAPVPFHWPLEFPEVFSARDSTGSGFDAIIGNPPFMGGTRISTAYGYPYLSYLIAQYENAGNRTDYISYFFQRAAESLGSKGYLGMVAPNSISESGTRNASLSVLLSRGFTIIRADPELRWEGSANVTVSPVHATNAQWTGRFILSGCPVTGISAYLNEPDPGAFMAEPHVLHAQLAVCGLGSKPNGSGFIIDAAERQRLLGNSIRSHEVVIPYLNAEDVTESIGAFPSRFAIYFGEMPEDICEANWPIEFSIVVHRVKPKRIVDKDRVRREKWWQFERHAKDVYEAIENLDRCLVVPEISKFLIFSWQSKKILFSNRVNVVSASDDAVFALLQSSIHEIFARRPGQSRLESRPCYNAAQCFRTFPPSPLTARMRVAGETYDDHRSRLCISRGLGLTALYNRVHDSDAHAEDIQQLRELRVEMDNAVATAYGWDDLDLQHGFHQTAQGVRFTISEDARREVLGRLLALNHERYAEEVAAGLHDGPKKAKGTATKGGNGTASRGRRASRTADAPTTLALPLGGADGVGR